MAFLGILTPTAHSPVRMETASTQVRTTGARGGALSLAFEGLPIKAMVMAQSHRGHGEGTGEPIHLPHKMSPRKHENDRNKER